MGVGMNRHTYYGISSRADNTPTMARSRSDAAWTDFVGTAPMRAWGEDLGAGIMLVGFMVGVWFALPLIAAVL